MSDYADILLNSNCIFTSTGEAPFAGHVAVSGSRIAAVGKGPAPAGLIGPETRIYDLGDATVSAGYTDSHCFFTGYSLGYVGVDVSSAKSCEEIISLAKVYAETIPADQPLLGRGWDETSIHPEGTAALDEAFGDRPVVLIAACGETCWMNQAAIDTFQFTPDRCWSESYWRMLRCVMQDHEYIVPRFKEYMKMMNSRGVTSVKEMGFDDYYGFTEILEQLEKAGELTIRVNFMSQPVGYPTNLEYGRAMREKFQGDFVRFSGYNQMTDGSISQLCGELKKPYHCADTLCAQEIDWDLLARDTRAVDAEGFRFSLHAQGDGAIGKVLDIYETCRRDENGRMVNRHCITDLEFSDPADLERMSRMGVIAEVYPQIQSIADRAGKVVMIEEKIGMERGRYYWNRRKMIDSGVSVCCATDLPLVIDNIPESMYHAVGGYFPEGGEPFNAQNMISREELLTAWTKGGAYTMYQEDALGTLEVGKKADIAVLSGNIFTEPMETIRNLSVILTLVDGKIVHEAR